MKFHLCGVCSLDLPGESPAGDTYEEGGGWSAFGVRNGDDEAESGVRASWQSAAESTEVRGGGQKDWLGRWGICGIGFAGSHRGSLQRVFGDYFIRLWHEIIITLAGDT